ncbi:MAG: preprotein translocase subunit SecE [Bacteroidetes bacterium]|jgi:preprotein translocase subunit SecE|nr:preprotein translocase subunit SecE [Bacteroidota bacterium]HQW45821.1 preprotein translocase subunit SecE [Chitinophagaceae bacterium]MBK7041435.1 preprotein translocase subunit SecE [Bacteroidota bacterium]MBK7587966.1 preprotein translocase subunit SecE [Bacteroidota bacterium]MBK8330633.1 preprotein translocase subunit SecE [Bacteroidota bacterium]
MNKILNYFEQAYNELIHKVTWPTWTELQQSTLITLFSILLLTALTTLMDGTSKVVFENFYGLFK